VSLILTFGMRECKSTDIRRRALLRACGMIGTMRIVVTLLALVIFLGLGAGAAEARVESGGHNFSIRIGNQTFGYIDWHDSRSPSTWTTLHLGPLGSQEVPFTALQGLILFCLSMGMVIGLVVVFATARRW
jgi:hypothetical protein